MRAAFVAGILGLVAGGALLVGASAQAPGQCSPGSIGLFRTIEIDTRGAPRFGLQQYKGNDPLRDREVILTFDDGPHKQLTQPVLEALDAHCTKATFFMVGQRALQYPELVRAVASRGHTVGTHTWSHQNLAKLEPAEATAEIEMAISAVQKSLGASAAPFFRFPYLAYSTPMHAHLASRNTGIFSIDIDSYDFKTRSPTVVIRNVMRQLDEKGRGIILFHDIQPSTAGALNQLLAELKAKGFKVVHMVPKQSQATVAEYDRRVGNPNSRRLASLPIPIAQRGIVSPAWDVQVYRGPGQPIGAISGPTLSNNPPPNAPLPRPTRRTNDEDWLKSIFRGW